MIYHHKIGTPTESAGDGDGLSTATPWYWYGKTQGQTVSLDNSGTSQDDNCRLYLRVKLLANTTYTIGETAPGGGDGKIWLYNESGTELVYNDDTDGEIAGVYCTDHFEYTPSTTGIYIIGAGAYSSSQGSYTVAMDPAPESDPVPTPGIIYPTSTGFNNWGKPNRFRSASAAGCAVSFVPTDGLVFYNSFNGEHTTSPDIGGNTLNVWAGTITYTTDQGVICGACSNLGMNVSKISTINKNPLAACIWFKGNSSTVSADIWNLSPGTSGDTGAGLMIYVDKSANKFGFASAGSYSYQSTNTFDLTQWHSLIVNTDGTTIQFYVDGEQEASQNLWNVNPDNRDGAFGARGSGYPYLNGFIAAARVYNRKLKASEISALAKEFNQTT